MRLARWYPDDMPTVMRLLLVAEARMNLSGHAHFTLSGGESELCSLLGSVDRETGELIPCDRTTVFRAKQKLAGWGMLAASSGGLTCVQVDSRYKTKGRDRHDRPKVAWGGGPVPVECDGRKNVVHPATRNSLNVTRPATLRFPDQGRS